MALLGVVSAQQWCIFIDMYSTYMPSSRICSVQSPIERCAWAFLAVGQTQLLRQLLSQFQSACSLGSAGLQARVKSANIIPGFSR